MKSKILIILSGIVFLVVGCLIIKMTNEKEKRCTVESVGTVIENIREESTDSDGYTTYVYHPVVEYQVKHSSKLVSEKYNTGRNPAKYKVGEKVDIKYNPEKVDEYIITSDKSNDFFKIVFPVVGILIIAIGIFKKSY